MFPLLSLIICLEMEQFAILPFSVYNSCNNPTNATKQELPKYKPEQTLRFFKDTLKEEINQQLRTSASPLSNKILQSPRIKLSNSYTLVLDGTETDVLLRHFAQRLTRKNVTLPDISFNSLDTTSITLDLVINRQAKGRERGAWLPFEI